MEYGLIGAKLGHSFSAQIHHALAGYDYQLCPLPQPENFEKFMREKDFRGVNVTIPYKQAVIPYLDEITPRAERIGAVNTIVNRGGRLCGDNTDYAGFVQLLRRKNYSAAGKHCMVLGTGGTHRTVCAALRDEGAASITVVSRTAREGVITYAQAQGCAQTQVIVNTTPVGMYPANGQSPIDLQYFGALEAVFDVIYNPFCSALLYQAKRRGLVYSDGLPMLVAQAYEAAKQFCGCDIAPQKAQQTLRGLKAQLANVVLIGMPSCGKSTQGKTLAKALGKTFVDTDKLVEQKAGKPIPQIFAQDGEEAFRRLETQALAEATAGNGQVIATGGGVVTREENLPLLAQNGPVIYLQRPLQHLSTGGSRPLSRDAAALREMYKKRGPLYVQAADKTVAVQKSFAETAAALKEAYDASIGD